MAGLGLAGAGRAVGANDALFELVKTRMLEEQQAAQERQRSFDRNLQTQQMGRLTAQDQIAAEDRAKQDQLLKFETLKGLPQADINANLGPDYSTGQTVQGPSNPAFPGGGPTYQIGQNPQSMPMDVNGAKVRPMSLEALNAAARTNALQKALDTPVVLGPDQTQFLGGQVLAKGQPKDEWTPIEVSIDGKNVQLERNPHGQYRTAVTQQPVTTGIGPKLPERDALGEALKQLQLGQQPTTADAVAMGHLIATGKMAPSQVNLVGGFGTAGAAFKRGVMMAALKENPDINFAAEESGYQFGKSAGTQTTVRMIDNIEKSLPILERASDDFARSNVRMINAALLAGKQQFGNTDTQAFQTARLGLADEIAKILSGGGTGNVTSDAKLKQANDLLAGDMTPGQLKATTSMVRELLGARRGALTQGTYMERPEAPQTPSAGISVTRGPDGKLIIKR